MKLFLANGAESDFTDDSDFEVSDSTNAHSAGAVILAETPEEAVKLLTDRKATGTLVEIPLDKPGVVLFASGDC